jgi:hypothetical protein
MQRRKLQFLFIFIFLATHTAHTVTVTPVSRAIFFRFTDIIRLALQLFCYYFFVYNLF